MFHSNYYPVRKISRIGWKNEPNLKYENLFLKQDRINCYSFSNEISKRISVYPFYIFGCFKSLSIMVMVFFRLCALIVFQWQGVVSASSILAFYVFSSNWWWDRLTKRFVGNFQHLSSHSPLCSMFANWSILALQQKTTMGLFMAIHFVGNILHWCFCLPALRSHFFSCSLLKKWFCNGRGALGQRKRCVFLRSLHQIILAHLQISEHC